MARRQALKRRQQVREGEAARLNFGRQEVLAVDARSDIVASVPRQKKKKDVSQ
jgi:hypothetical protein